MNLERFVQVPGGEFLISMLPLQASSEEYTPFDEIVLDKIKQGFLLPSPQVFFSHYRNVRDAVENDSPLLDGSGKPISKYAKRRVWHALNHNFFLLNAQVYSKHSNIDDSLDADIFKTYPDLFDMGVREYNGVDFRGKLTCKNYTLGHHVSGIDWKSSLSEETCSLKSMEGVCLVDLDSLDKRGYPTKKSDLGNYVRGKNMRFFPMFTRKEWEKYDFLGFFNRGEETAFGRIGDLAKRWYWGTTPSFITRGGPGLETVSYRFSDNLWRDRLKVLHCINSKCSVGLPGEEYSVSWTETRFGGTWDGEPYDELHTERTTLYARDDKDALLKARALVKSESDGIGRQIKVSKVVGR